LALSRKRQQISKLNFYIGLSYISAISGWEANYYFLSTLDLTHRGLAPPGLTLLLSMPGSFSCHVGTEMAPVGPLSSEWDAVGMVDGLGPFGMSSAEPSATTLIGHWNVTFTAVPAFHLELILVL
jgi:hypothetical protein